MRLEIKLGYGTEGTQDLRNNPNSQHYYFMLGQQ